MQAKSQHVCFGMSASNTANLGAVSAVAVGCVALARCVQCGGEAVMASMSSDFQKSGALIDPK